MPLLSKTGKRMSLSKYEKNMMEAIAAVRRGIPCATAAKQYGINRTTLLYRCNGKSKKSKKGPDCVLGDEAEIILVKWIKDCQKAKFPILPDELKTSVKQIVKQLHIETPFINEKPGKKWLASFLARHPDVDYRTPEYLSQARASVTEGTIKQWFDEVEKYITECEIDMNDPRRIFNCDESGFYLNPKGKKVLAEKGSRDVHQKSKNCDKENYTVLMTINVAGEFAPSMVVFALDRISSELAESVPLVWGIGRSKSGWMTAETFYEYITNVFNPWLEETKISKPVVLFLDGHSSHLSLHLSMFCKEQQIVLISLYPNTTHICQPLDVSVFKPLKSKWRDAVAEFKSQKFGKKLTRCYFSFLLYATTQKLIVETLVNGFKHCGLYPFTSAVVPSLFERKKKKNANNSNDELQTYQKKTSLMYIENIIGQKKILDFQNDSYNIEDTGLYMIWKNMSGHISREQNTSESLEELSFELGLQINTGPIGQCSTLNTSEFQISSPLNITSQSTTSNHINIPSDIRSSTPNISSPSNIVPQSPATNYIIPSTSSTNAVYSNESYTPPKSSEPPINIPSPFKKALYWPRESERDVTKQKKKKEKLPAAITSEKWQEYHKKVHLRKKAALKEKEKKTKNQGRKKT